MKFEIIMPSTMDKKKANEYKEAIKKNIKENTNIDVDKLNKENKVMTMKNINIAYVTYIKDIRCKKIS